MYSQYISNILSFQLFYSDLVTLLDFSLRQVSSPSNSLRKTLTR